MQTRSIAARALFAACVVALAPAALAQANDSTLSRHIREADGTTGQDTNTGSGVKTGHLQDGAVTAPKLAPAAVGTAAIADGAVTASKLAPVAVGTAAIADGAVTTAKIAGTIPATKIDRTGLDADSLDGYHSGDFSAAMHDHVPSEIQGLDAFRKKHQKVIVVAQDGTGDFTDPATAVAAIGWAGYPIPYLVKVMPGTYDVPSFNPPGGVDVEGSGQNNTRIIVHGQTVIRGQSEVRDLTIECPGSSAELYMYGDTNPARLTRAKVVKTGELSAAYMSFFTRLENAAVLDGVTITAELPPSSPGSLFTVYVTGGSHVIRNSEIRTSGIVYAAGVVLTSYAKVLVESSRISVSGAQAAHGFASDNLQTEATIRSSTVVAESASDQPNSIDALQARVATVEGSVLSAVGPNAVAARTSGGTISLAHTRTEGLLDKGQGTFRCIGVYDANFAPVTCP